MNTQAIAVQFHDQSITAAIIDSIPHVAMKPICENIGLQWEGQLQRIKRHPVLSSVMCMTHTTGSDGKLYEMMMLPLDYLNGWLFGVDTNRVKNGTRERLIEYQRECFKVLANHFMPQEVRSDLVGILTSRIKTLEGELLPKDCPKYSAPISELKISNRLGRSAWLTYPEMKKQDCLSKLLRTLKKDNHDVEGAIEEYNGLWTLLNDFYHRLDVMKGVFEAIDRRGRNVTFE